MKLIVVSGRSGSGKSTALNALEDQGFHCIDNLPVRLLPALVSSLSPAEVVVPFAVSIDARNLPAELERFPEIFDELKGMEETVSFEILFLDAQSATLVRRFSETRRRHPLTGENVHLREALEVEQKLLAGIVERADLVLDTTSMTVHELREEISQRVAQRQSNGPSLMFRSFGFKSGVPVDADMVFDVRCLPNPHWEPALRDQTGRDGAVIHWLSAHSDVADMEADITRHLERWLPAFEANSRSYLTVAIGCTGGQHRSVFLAERLARHFLDQARDVLVRHRELGELRRVTDQPDTTPGDS